MRADRLISIMLLLQARGQMTASDLALELEVSERTIYRDITALGTAGVPVCSERGPGGGISLLESYRSDLTGLNKDEVQALFLLSIPPPLGDLGMEQELKAALLKLSAALPPSLRLNQKHILQRVFIDSRPWDQQPQITFPHLKIVQKAVWEDRVLSVQYYSIIGQRIGPMKAKIHPYGLVARGGNWYLIGGWRDHIDVLRVDYLLDTRIEDEVLIRPQNFNLVEFWEAWCRESEENRPFYPVIARVSKSVMYLIKNKFGEDVYTQGTEAENQEPSDWLTVMLPFEYHEQALETLLPFGRTVEVLTPIALRFSIIDYAEQILTIYSTEMSERS